MCGVIQPVELLDEVAVVSLVWTRFIVGWYKEGLATFERVRAGRRCAHGVGRLR